MASATDAGETLRSTYGKENFQRLTRLLMCGGVRLLREIFDTIHLPKDLPLKLGDPAIRSQLNKAKLSRAEWSCLYPSPGTFGKSTDFDITLTFRLLRTICNLTAPVTGWDSLPVTSDLSLEADLARIKFYRNSIYGHNQKMEISDSEFCYLWKEVSEALLRIAGNLGPLKTDEWEKSIGRLLTDPLTPEAQSCVEELELWYKKDMDVKGSVEHLKDQLQQVKIDVKDQFQKFNEKLDSILITFELERFSRREQHLAHFHSGPGSTGITPLSVEEQRPQSPVAEATSGGNQRNGQNPSEASDIWKVILSFKESFTLLLEYLSKQLKLRILHYGTGSLCITTACSSLEILEGLWKDYSSGHLNKVAEEILFTSEVLERLSLSEVKLRTVIREEDYHKHKQFLVDEGEDLKSESRKEEEETEKNEQEENLKWVMRTMKQEVARLQSQLRKKELREARIVKEMEQREKDSHRELEEMAQQLRNVTKKVRDLKYVKEELISVGEQPHEKDEPMSILQRQVAILKDQLRARDHEISELQTTLSVTRRKLFERKAQESPDWVISRDQIQLTDKRLSHGAWGFWVEGKYCGCVVAVKQIHETVRSPYNLTLFERGMHMASSCRHPCLLQFIGATNDEGSQLFVTELMETSLQALLENQPLCQTEIFVISLDVARALNYLHQKHPCPILHRNVSSSKVLLWRQGQQWRAKLSGCGTVNFKKHTTTMYPGDRRYSAPEAMTANQTEKIDVYSFGVLLCEMNIREMPDPQRREEQIAMVMQRVLRTLIRGCVQKKPQTRPNMKEIIAELEQSQ